MTYIEKSISHAPWRFCIAPMMDWSDRHCRFFWRLQTQEARLYTEMVTTGAMLHGDRDYLLGYDAREHPLALQVGGSNPTELAQCAEIATQRGFAEVNLNCGCPSDRVQHNKIGACLMAEPELVAKCVKEMKKATDRPVTVKHRLGIDELDSWEHLVHFVDTVAHAGCEVFIVHARKAWLQGLSPKQNREVPPLNYARVIKLKEHFPHLTIIVNGGIQTLEQCESLLGSVDGVMMGREAYNNPYILNDVDSRLFNSCGQSTKRGELMAALITYCEQQLEQGVKLHHVTRHILGLYNGVPGARAFRRHLSTHATRPGAHIEVIQEALGKLQDETTL